MADIATQTPEPQAKSPTKSEHPRVHTPVPTAFHDSMATMHAHAHPHAHKHMHGHEPAKEETVSGLEAEVAIKTQEIHALRAEANQLEAKLFHDEEVIQIKEHELGRLEGKLIAKEEQEARSKEGDEGGKENRRPRVILADAS